MKRKTASGIRVGDRGTNLRRVLAAIRLLTSEGCTVAELAARLDCGWRTAYRLVEAIEEAGIAVSRSEEGERAGDGERGTRPALLRIRPDTLREVFGLGPTRRTWTTEQEEQLIALRRDGMTAREIAQLLGHTVEAVGAQASRMRKRGRIE